MIWKPVMKTFRKPYVIIFYLTDLVEGVADRVFYGLVFLLLEDIGSKKVLMGLNMVLQSLFRAITYLVANWCINAVGGTDFAMSISILSLAIRLLLVSFFKKWKCWRDILARRNLL